MQWKHAACQKDKDNSSSQENDSQYFHNQLHKVSQHFAQRVISFPKLFFLSEI